MDEVTGFSTLFLGSQAGYGTEEGGCDKDTSLSHYERVIQHLEGDRPMGVYPLRGPNEHGVWEVHWGCVDFDEGEEKSLAYALNVQQVIAAVGATAWVERSRSKGYHVWIFLAEWFPAWRVREALLGACQTVGAPTKEINPKSISLQPGQLGNYVRLPYPGALADPNPFPKDRRVVIDTDPEVANTIVAGAALAMPWFVEKALESRLGYADIVNLQALYVEPVRVLPVLPVETTGDMHKRMSGLAWTVYQDGPLQDAGRGHTLFKLACLLREGGAHTQGEALSLCIEADQRWGKMHLRNNAEQQVAQVVAKAWGA